MGSSISDKQDNNQVITTAKPMQYPTNSNVKVNLNIGNHGSGIFYDKPVFTQYGGSYTPKYNSKGERNYIKDY